MKSINWGKSKYLLLFCLFFVFVACDSEPPIVSNNINVGESTACGGNLDHKLNLKKVIKLVNENDELCYETLKWKYNETDKKISFVNTNVALNCCGERKIISYKEENINILEEIDKSEDGARCNCMCTYSFFVELSNIEKGDFTFKLLRSIEENDEKETVLEETLDLNNLEGKINIKEINCK